MKKIDLYQCIQQKDYFIEWAIRYFISKDLLPNAAFEKLNYVDEEKKESGENKKEMGR